MDGWMPTWYRAHPALSTESGSKRVSSSNKNKTNFVLRYGQIISLLFPHTHAQKMTLPPTELVS